MVLAGDLAFHEEAESNREFNAIILYAYNGALDLLLHLQLEDEVSVTVAKRAKTDDSADFLPV